MRTCNKGSAAGRDFNALVLAALREHLLGMGFHEPRFENRFDDKSFTLDRRHVAHGFASVRVELVGDLVAVIWWSEVMLGDQLFLQLADPGFLDQFDKRLAERFG